jgi:hypothetical protein
MQGIGVLLRDGGRRPPVATLSDKARSRNYAAAAAVTTCARSASRFDCER